MTDKNKPISSSNPPESRGNRDAKDQEILVNSGEEIKGKQAVYQPTEVAPSPATQKKSTTKKNQ